VNATSVCKGCDAPIFWANTEAGKFIPMDPEASLQGNCWIDRYERGIPVVRVADRATGVPPSIALRYISHWATCPNPPARHAREARPVHQ